MAAWCSAHDRAFHYLPLGISRPGNTAALWQRADDLGVEPITDVELSVRHYHSALPQIESFLHQMDVLYLSIDLDILPAATMPAVSAPAGLGVPLEVILELVERIAASGKLLAADVVEYNPLHDVQSMGAKAAARILWELCYHWKTSP
jgi:formiminoglutamase